MLNSSSFHTLTNLRLWSRVSLISAVLLAFVTLEQGNFLAAAGASMLLLAFILWHLTIGTQLHQFTECPGCHKTLRRGINCIKHPAGDPCIKRYPAP